MADTEVTSPAMAVLWQEQMTTRRQVREGGQRGSSGQSGALGCAFHSMNCTELFPESNRTPLLDRHPGSLWF